MTSNSLTGVGIRFLTSKGADIGGGGVGGKHFDVITGGSVSPDARGFAGDEAAESSHNWTGGKSVCTQASVRFPADDGAGVHQFLRSSSAAAWEACAGSYLKPYPVAAREGERVTLQKAGFAATGSI